MATPDPTARSAPDHRLLDPQAWAYFRRCYRGKLKLLLAYGAIAAAQSLLVLPVLWLIRRAFDVAIPGGDLAGLVWIGAGIFGLRLVNSGVALWLRAAHIRLIKQAVQRLREDLLLKLYTFSRTFYTKLDRNTTHTQIVQDTERLDNMSNQLVSKMLPAVFTSVALVVVLLFLNWVLLLVMIALAPLLLLAARLTGRLVKQHVFAFQRGFERFSKGMMFVLQHMDLTRTQSFEQGEIERRTRDLDHLRETGQRMALVFALHGQVQSTVVGVCGIVLLVVGGAAVASGSMTLGEFLSFWVAASLLNGHVSTLSGSIPQIISGNESMVTLFRFAQIGERHPYEGTRRIEFAGSIEVRGAEFAYDGAPVLRGADLSITPTSNLAIVGPNGAGKSTILYLVLGFYRPAAGRVLADGVPYEEIDLVDLRRSIGVVMQHPTFFSGSIYENIVYGHADADRERVVRAARLALADDFIRDLPDGYDTQVGEDGVLLSGGEVQRIAIARALLREPKLLVLDEPTNHLDKTVVARLMANLKSLDHRPAIMTISHDREVIEHADEVYQLTDGRLVRTPAARSAAGVREGVGGS